VLNNTSRVCWSTSSLLNPVRQIFYRLVNLPHAPLHCNALTLFWWW